MIETREQWLEERMLRLAAVGAWDELILLRLAHRHFPALRTAAHVLGEKAATDPTWCAAAAFVQAATVDQFDAVQPFWRGLPGSLTKPARRRGRACLRLLRLYGYGTLCELASGYPAQRDEMLADGVAAAWNGIRLSRALGEKACEALFLGILGTGLSYQGHELPAIRAFREAISLRSRSGPRIPGFQDVLLAPALNNLADLHLERREYGLSFRYYRESARRYQNFARAAKPLERLHHGQALNNCALALYRLARHDDALAFASEADAAYGSLPAAMPGRDHAIASLSMNTGMMLEATGRPPAAIAAYDRSLTLYRQEPESFERLADLAMTLSNRANALHALGDLPAALQDYDQAISHYTAAERDLPGGFTVPLHATLVNRALTLAGLGHYERALQSCDEAIERLSALPAGRRLAMERATALNTRASVLTEIGRLDDALAASRETETLFRELNTLHPGAFLTPLTAATNNLANLLGQLQRWPEALPLYQTTVAAMRTQFRRRPEMYLGAYSSALNGLASALAETGVNAAAIRIFRQALRHRRALAAKMPAAGRSLVAATLANLGSELHKAGRLRDAWESYVEALELLRAAPDRAGRAAGVLWLTHAAALLRQGLPPAHMPDLPRALALLREALALDAAARLQVRQPVNRRGFSERHQPMFDLLLAVHLDLAEAVPHGGASVAGNLAGALEAAEAGRARWIADLLIERPPVAAPEVLRDQYAQTRRKSVELSSQLAWDERALAERAAAPLPVAPNSFRGFVPSGPTGRTSRKINAAAHAELDRLLAKQEHLIAQLQVYDPQWQAGGATVPSASALQANIPPGVVVIYLALLAEENGKPARSSGPPGSVVLAVTCERIVHRRLPGITTESVAGSMARWLDQRQHAAASPAARSRWSRSLAALLEFLGDKLLQPLAELLWKEFPGMDRVVFVPHRVLHLVPLAACPVRPPDGRASVPFGEIFQVSLLPSLGSLSLALRPVPEGTGQAVIIAPELSDRETALPFARAEARQVAHRHGAGAVSLRGKHATRTAVLANTGSADRVHFCGHARYEAGRPLDSRLVLAGAPGLPGHGLTVADCLSALSLPRCRLAVLNCCEGSYALPSWSDDHIPLSLGFLLAGSRCVISTLWHVDDLATMLLIERFYELLAGSGTGLTPCAALAAAQRWLRGLHDGKEAVRRVEAIIPDMEVADYAGRFAELQTISTPPFAAPSHWSGYVVTGLGW